MFSRVDGGSLTALAAERSWEPWPAIKPAMQDASDRERLKTHPLREFVGTRPLPPGIRGLGFLGGNYDHNIVLFAREFSIEGLGFGKSEL